MPGARREYGDVFISPGSLLTELPVALYQKAQHALDSLSLASPILYGVG